MAFDWKKTLKDGKEKAGAAFKQAVEAGKVVVTKANETLQVLDEKVDEGTNRLVTKVEEKVLNFRKKKDEKKDGPANS